MYGSTAQQVTPDRRPRRPHRRAARRGRGRRRRRLPAGTYLSRPHCRHDPLSRVHLTGVGDRGSGFLASRSPRRRQLVHVPHREPDDRRGGAMADPAWWSILDKSYLRHWLVPNWAGLRDLAEPGPRGTVNWIDDNSSNSARGTGIHTTYRFYDSWIVNNNVGSTGPEPVRWRKRTGPDPGQPLRQGATAQHRDARQPVAHDRRQHLRGRPP